MNRNHVALPVAKAQVVLREELDDWAILYDPDSARAAAVSPVGVSIWKRLDGRHSLTSLCEELRSEFEDVPSELGEDVKRFISQLVQHGFLSPDDAGREE